MKEKKFIVGTGVVVTLKDGREIHGTIASVDTNICTWKEEYSVNYVKKITRFGLSYAYPHLTLN